MQNKGFIRLFSILLTIVCLYCFIIALEEGNREKFPHPTTSVVITSIVDYLSVYIFVLFLQYRVEHVCMFLVLVQNSTCYSTKTERYGHTFSKPLQQREG